jgi:hypothetical protein
LWSQFTLLTLFQAWRRWTYILPAKKLQSGGWLYVCIAYANKQYNETWFYNTPRLHGFIALKHHPENLYHRLAAYKQIMCCLI